MPHFWTSANIYWSPPAFNLSSFPLFYTHWNKYNWKPPVAPSSLSSPALVSVAEAKACGQRNWCLLGSAPWGTEKDGEGIYRDVKVSQHSNGSKTSISKTNSCLTQEKISSMCWKIKQWFKWGFKLGLIYFTIQLWCVPQLKNKFMGRFNQKYKNYFTKKINLLNGYIISQQTLKCGCIMTNSLWLSKPCRVQYECYEVEWKDMVKQNWF